MHERRTALTSTAVASEQLLSIAERNRFQLSLTTNKARPALPRPALPTATATSSLYVVD